MMQPTRNPPSGWVLQQREREKPPALGEAILPVARPLPSGSCAWAAPSGPPEPREQPREQPEELPAERGMEGMERVSGLEDSRQEKDQGGRPLARLR